MSSRKLKIGAAIGVAAVVGSAVAYTQWAGEASGPGRATATTAVEATVSPFDGPPDLFPGQTEGDVWFTIDNENPYPLVFTAMAPGEVTASDPDCPDDSITVEAADGLDLEAPPEGVTDEMSIESVVSMSEDAPEECQGAFFDIELTLTGTQAPNGLDD